MTTTPPHPTPRRVRRARGNRHGRGTLPPVSDAALRRGDPGSAASRPGTGSWSTWLLTPPSGVASRSSHDTGTMTKTLIANGDSMTNDQPHAGCGGRKATGTGEAPASPGGQRHHRHRSDPRSAGQGGQHGRAQGGTASMLHSARPFQAREAGLGDPAGSGARSVRSSTSAARTSARNPRWGVAVPAPRSRPAGPPRPARSAGAARAPRRRSRACAAGIAEPRRADRGGGRDPRVVVAAAVLVVVALMWRCRAAARRSRSGSARAGGVVARHGLHRDRGAAAGVDDDRRRMLFCSPAC